MLFSSITFLVLFLPLTLVVYYLIPKKWQNAVMLAASLFFYAWGETVYVVLLFLSAVLNYFCGRDIYEKREDPVRSRRSLTAAIVMNLLLLGFFKYYPAAAGALNGAFQLQLPCRELQFPAGLSFFTFQAVSYLTDIYRKQITPQNNVVKFTLYLCMFPKLLAGPVVRYGDIEKQLDTRTLSVEKFGRGAMLFITGLAKKILLADTMGAVCEQISGMQAGTFSALTAWTGCICYAFQIYFDLSGYSDMALGLGKMFGFEYRRNFRYPYAARTLRDFWRRWHISVTSWFRDYVYLPLGRSRSGEVEDMCNIMLTGLAAGLWHGAQWNYVVGGIYFAFLLIMEKYVWGANIRRFPRVVQHIYTMVIVLIGWVFFSSADLGTALDYLGAMFGIGASGIFDKQGFFLLLTHWLVLLLCILASSAKGQQILHRMMVRYKKVKVRKAAVCVVYIGMFLLSIVFLAAEGSRAFIYSGF